MIDRRQDSIMRMPDVVTRTGLKRPTIYRLIAAGQFPSKLQLSPGCVGFYASDVEAWIAARDAQKAA